MDLTGKRIVLIGGSAGIGLATAKQAAKLGASLVIAGRTEERLSEAVAAIDGPVQTHQLDGTDEKAVADFFAEVGQFDHLSILVPAAPDKTVSKKFVRFLDMASEDFASVFVNRFWSQCYAARHGAPHLNPHGSLVFVSSIQPRKAIPQLFGQWRGIGCHRNPRANTFDRAFSHSSQCNRAWFY